MDSQVVNELARHYRDRSLRFTPKVFSQFGIHRTSVFLVVQDVPISCVPFEFSSVKGTLLAVLSDREASHLLEKAEAPSKLVISRQLPDDEKPQVFHIPVHLEGIQRPGSGSSYCLVSVQVVRMPFEILEFLVAQFFQADQADAFVANLVDVPFHEEDLRSLFRSVHVVSQKGASAGDRLKILSYSVKAVRIFGEWSGPFPEVGDPLEFLPHQGDRDCLVGGTCRSVKVFDELPGFCLVELDHTPGLEVVKKLMKLAKTAKTPFLAAPAKKTD